MKSTRWTVIALTVGVLLPAVADSARGQDSTTARVPALSVTSSFAPERWIPADSPIALMLSRPLTSDEGRVAVLIGSTDVTSLFERSGTVLRYGSRALRLPSGESEVVVYTVNSRRWTEVARLAIKVLTPAGFSAASAKPSASINNKGQLAEGHSGLQPSPDPATYQDLGFSGGLQTTHERDGWRFQTTSNYVGASRRQEALRYGDRHDRAPKIDLSDYVLQLERGPASLSLGHVSAGTNRHLINSFASRGVEARVGGTRASVTVSALNGSSVVGWNNFTGLENGDHRVQSGTLNLELVPSRPGAIHLDATLMNGSLLPQTSFTQGAVVDAERSTGAGVQFSAATPSQRLRVAGGLSKSRFNNPAKDHELTGDTTVVPVREERRGAYYVEANAGLLQNASVGGLFSTSVNAVYRREQVDPMYRTVAAQTQSDRVQDTYEIAGNVGVVNLQISHNRYHDNLNDIASILKTLNRMSTVQVSAPLAGLLRIQRGASFLPAVNYGLNRVHQFGAGIPLNSEFSATHVPDQMNDLHNAAAAWQIGRWRLQYRYNQNIQDNRQAGRERADFFGVSNAISVDVSVRSNFDVGYEGSSEHQTSRETSQTNRTRHAGGTLTWRPTALTTITSLASINVTRDDPLTSDVTSTEQRLELAQGFNLGRTPAGGGTRGQFFLRYGNTSGTNWAFPGGPVFSRTERAGWTLTSGMSLRLY